MSSGGRRQRDLTSVRASDGLCQSLQAVGWIDRGSSGRVVQQKVRTFVDGRL